jgi:hypothetical protein
MDAENLNFKEFRILKWLSGPFLIKLKKLVNSKVGAQR